MCSRRTEKRRPPVSVCFIRETRAAQTVDVGVAWDRVLWGDLDSVGLVAQVCAHKPNPPQVHLLLGFAAADRRTDTPGQIRQHLRSSYVGDIKLAGVLPDTSVEVVWRVPLARVPLHLAGARALVRWRLRWDALSPAALVPPRLTEHDILEATRRVWELRRVGAPPAPVRAKVRALEGRCTLVCGHAVSQQVLDAVLDAPGGRSERDRLLRSAHEIHMDPERSQVSATTLARSASLPAGAVRRYCSELGDLLPGLLAPARLVRLRSRLRVPGSAS
jgi:hypothetical protein